MSLCSGVGAMLQYMVSMAGALANHISIQVVVISSVGIQNAI